MIGNRAEYEKMHRIESKLWWYQILHGKVFAQIKSHFGIKNDIKILDAGCGTGGMLAFLKSNGYENITGFDISNDAVDFCAEKGLKINQFDIRNIKNYGLENKFDVIICNDMLYFLSDEEIIETLKIFSQLIDRKGIVLINIHAFEVFSGSHDVAVGSTRRFVLSQFEAFAHTAFFTFKTATYWSFLLSPLILFVRLWQNFSLKVGLQNAQNSQSDVEYPGHFVNSMLLKIVKIEEKLMKKAPFGSSLFMALQPK